MFGSIRHNVKTHVAVLLIGLSIAIAGTVAADESNTAGTKPQRAARGRSFLFQYGAVVRDLPVGARIRIWVPVPQKSVYQSVTRIGQDLPFPAKLTREPKYGNQMLYMEGRLSKTTPLTISISYDVQRAEVLGLASTKRQELTDAQRKLFLSHTTRVPTDGKPVQLLDKLKLPKRDKLKLGHLLYDTVEKHMSYDKSRPGYGTGDAVWACDSRYGNCTDFHSLFISLARSQGLPSRFEIGFPLAEKRGSGDIGGYHCWAFFHTAQHGWLPVDISEADKHPEMKKYYFGSLTENRIAFTVGRDVMLVPQQETGPLNYFIYPHVEVDGQIWPRAKMQKQFRFEDR